MDGLVDAASHVRDAYNAIAHAYDGFTRGYPYERWLHTIEEVALEHGLRGRRLLDVACGTGSSFLPLLSKGYSVTGCDVSERMLQQARIKAPSATLHTADMCSLGAIGEFDLVTCLDDPLNYLLSEEDVLRALRGFRRNLAPGGLVVWDVNTLAQYREQFSTARVYAERDRLVGWSPLPRDEEPNPGELVEVAVEVVEHISGEAWSRKSTVHRQRHWPRHVMQRLCAQADLQVLDVRGQHLGAVIDTGLDELVHTKAIYVACARRRGG